MSLVAQDALFVQPSGGNIYLNPALVGNDSVARLGLIYRIQWPNLSSAFETAAVNFYQFIPKFNAYGGISYLRNDHARGNVISNNFSIFYSQNINIKKVLLRPSVEVAFGNRKLDDTRLNFGNTMYPSSQAPLNTTTQKQNLNYTDLNFGVMAYYKKFLLGLSAHHILEPNVGFGAGHTELPIRYGVQMGYQIAIKKVVLSPFGYFRKQQYFTSVLFGANALLYNHLNLALSYGTSDRIISNIGYENKFFRINYSFDYTFSKLAVNSAYSHEIGLSFRFWKTKPKMRLIGVNSVFS